MSHEYDGRGAESDENDADRRRAGFLSRRSAIKRVGIFGGILGLATLGGLRLASEPVLASSGHDDWVTGGASITAHDGSVDAVTFGDAGDAADALHLSWSGLNAADRPVNFRILLKGGNDGDSVGWTGGTTVAETSYEQVAITEPGITLTTTNGSAEHTWTDVFGADQPVNVADHSEIDVTADFSADDDGEVRTRELAVDVEVWINEEDGTNGPTGDALGDRKAATATIEVTNEAATIAVGGQGTFELSSSEEV